MTTPDRESTGSDVNGRTPTPELDQPPPRERPMKTLVVRVVEEIPTHDGTTCFSAWDDWAPSKTDPEHAQQERAGDRPTWSQQIYDTTPHAADPEHIYRLAETLHVETEQDRCEIFDRVDVYGLPLPLWTSARERAERCIAHNVAESRARNATGRSDFYIPPTFADEGAGYQHALVIIDRPRERWEVGPDRGDGGGFLNVRWNPASETKEERHIRLGSPDWAAVLGDAYPDKNVRRFPWSKLSETLFYNCERARWFGDDYVSSGVLARMLRECAREHRQ